MSESRCPKDIKNMISSTKLPANDAGDTPIEELAKLRGLAADDKTQNAMLRSRIDEQSELIMILKTQSDETATKLKTSERIRESLEDFRKNAQGAIAVETAKCEMLDRRFNELAENHQELIKFKDQYKIENESLKRENAKLKADNEKLFSAAIQERDESIEDLEKQLKVLKDKCNNLEENSLESHKSMIENRNVLQERLEKTENNLNSIISKLEQQLLQTELQLKETTKKYQESHKNSANQDLEQRGMISDLSKEKEELLALVMQRGKIIEDKVTEMKKLEGKAEEAKKRQREAEDRFEKEAAAVDSNIQVIKLRKELLQSQNHMSDIDKKFEAYKAHTNKLLMQERELNAKLRHLTG
ncbi:coiled-coil domain-containing protein 89-like [Watersipora subatra]|uniref:coiled-coil domain-containing protein 89-like n=1 Tax=Watersipora subatra TaxID=2589382 RepID=UPI00355BFE68